MGEESPKERVRYLSEVDFGVVVLHRVVGEARVFGLVETDDAITNGVPRVALGTEQKRRLVLAFVDHLWARVNVEAQVVPTQLSVGLAQLARERDLPVIQKYPRCSISAALLPTPVRYL